MFDEFDKIRINQIGVDIKEKRISTTNQLFNDIAPLIREGWKSEITDEMIKAALQGIGLMVREDGSISNRPKTIVVENIPRKSNNHGRHPGADGWDESGEH